MAEEHPSSEGDVALSERVYRPGDVVAGRYELERVLQSGGMGVVWVARSKALDVSVALKLLASSSSAELIERMANEAHAVASLGHPAIVRVIDFGVTPGAEPFIAMELLEGEDLSELLARETKLPPERAAGLLLPIIEGLAAAHHGGIVHRDIKPENLFLAKDPLGRVQPKVLDFGIAKITDGRAAFRLTQTGAMLGTPQYLSPEQAYGREDVGFQSDIWSIGVVLYELVTGTQPFSGKNYNALIRSITQDAPGRAHGVADEQLWRIIERCLQKEPEDRWESMWALGEALALWLVERGIDLDAASRSLRGNWLAGELSGVQILEPWDGREPPSVFPPLAASLPVSVRPRPDSIAHPPVVTEQRPRPAARRRARSIVRRTAGGAALLAVPFFVWAWRQPPAHGENAAATAASDERPAASPLVPARPAPSAVPAPFRSTQAEKAVPAPSRSPLPVKRTRPRAKAAADPEFGF